MLLDVNSRPTPRGREPRLRANAAFTALENHAFVQLRRSRPQGTMHSCN